MKPIVFYHSPCLDGFTAAWVAWTLHPDWEYVPMKYGTELPDVTGRDVYFLDFSVKRDKMIEVINKANHVVVIDHHKTAQADLSGLAIDFPNIDVFFDMEHSGAMLAWYYFNNSQEEPAIIRYVEDRDLWRFKIPDSKAVNAYLFAYEYDFEFWKYLARDVEESLDYVIGCGNMILRKESKDIREFIKNSFRILLQSVNVPIVNAPYQWASDICHILAENEPFAASFYVDGARDKVVVSLRSHENGMDVSEIAKQYGGGGHKHAAGFEVPTTEFMKRIIVSKVALSAVA